METQPELLAQHCAEAGLSEKAVGYWLKAGQQAIARSAMTEAVAQLRKGLDLLVQPARRHRAPGAGARSADRARTRADRDEGICRAGAGRGVRSRTRALRAIKPAGAIGAGSVRPMGVSPRPRGAGPGGTPCRGDASPGRGPERRDVEMFRLAHAAGTPASFLASSSTPAPISRMLSPYGTRRYRASRADRRKIHTWRA